MSKEAKRTAARVTSKGQVTLPRRVRQALGVVKGDRLVFSISPSGRITVSGERPQPETRLLGLLAPYARGRAVTVAEMGAAVRRQAAARARRSRGR
jgi:AbrB family looped-hinge helix DNA binding protein